MGNTTARESLIEPCSSCDETTINRGTLEQPKPLLKFHSIHGENVQLLDEGRIARRKESFCKALAFSNRPISVDEIVCLSLCEVGTSWSGVLRFGVTNMDPASFRDIELPKFVCPDLTSKPGYWAKALAERYSTDKAILHFFVNADGELHYGINGISKGLFLSGINVSLPLWIVVDIYGNSVGVEFMDPCVVKLRSLSKVLRMKNSPQNHERPHSTTTLITAVDSAEMDELTGTTPTALGVNSHLMTASTSASNLTANEPMLRNARNSNSARASPFESPLCFHSVKGSNVMLDHQDRGATRRHGEYNLGYVFTNRPLHIDETISIMVLQHEDAFTGSLAFGLTSCDPVNVAASRLPADSDDLLERSEYWVCIKDVGAQPHVGDRLTFRVDGDGKVFFTKNSATPKVIMHVDVSIPLWAFFDLYGTTGQIILDNNAESQVESNGAISSSSNARSHRASSEGAFGAAPTLRSASNITDEHSSTGALPTLIYSSGASGDVHPNLPYSPISANNQRNRIFTLGSNVNVEQLRVALPPLSSNEAWASHASSSEGNLRAYAQPRFIPIPNSGGDAAGGSSMSSSASSSGHDVDHIDDRTRFRSSIRLHHLSRSSRPSTTPVMDGISRVTPLSTTISPPSSAVRNTSPSAAVTSGNTTATLLGDDFDLMAARYSSMLTSRRRGQGTSFSASSDPSTVRNTTTYSTSPTTSSYATPSATPASYRNFLNEALQCLNDVSSHTSSARSNSSSLFSTYATGSSALSTSRNHHYGSPATNVVAKPSQEMVKSASANNDDSNAADSLDGGISSECSICMNSRVNAVIYRCGHMCMCFPCAKELNRRSGDCPICRTPIIDVIRCYPA